MEEETTTKRAAKPAESTIAKVRLMLTDKPVTAVALSGRMRFGAATITKALDALVEKGEAIKTSDNTYKATNEAGEVAHEVKSKRSKVDEIEALINEALAADTTTKVAGVLINRTSKIIHLAECSWVAKNPEAYRDFTEMDGDSMGAELVERNACRRCKAIDVVEPWRAGR
jgi:hypothetical protein